MRGALRFAYREQAGGMSEHMATNDFGGKRLRRRNRVKGHHRAYQLLQTVNNLFQAQNNYHHGSRWQPLAAVGSWGRNILEQKVRNCCAAAAATAAAAAATASSSAAAAASVAASAGCSWRPPK